MGDPPALRLVSADKEPEKILWVCKVLYKRGRGATMMKPRVVAGRPFVFYTQSPPAWLVSVGLYTCSLLSLCWAHIHGPSSSRQSPLAQDPGLQGSVLLSCLPFWLETPGSLRKHGVQVNKWPFVRKVN